MTREEAIICKIYLEDLDKHHTCNEYKLLMGLLEQEPCDDTISRQAVLDLAKFDGRENLGSIIHAFDVEQLPPVTPAEKVGHCKQCKWWKDSDGAYRRGMRAESKCPMNTQKVYEGDGYCYLYEPKMQEVKNDT